MSTGEPLQLEQHENEAFVRWRAAVGDREYIPTWGEYWPRNWSAESEARREIASRFSWAIATDEALAAIAEVAPIVEIGAGTGWWAHLLRQRGVDVVAYDAMPPSRKGANSWHPSATMWTTVERGDATVAAQHPERTLFLCWPPYDTPMAADALRAYLDAGGRRLVYVGEGEGGCCASDDFFTLVDRMRAMRSIDIPQWFGIHDRLTIYAAHDRCETEGR